MLESRLINSVLPPVIVLFSTWLSLCHMLVFNAFLTVHATFCLLCVFLLCLCSCVFMCCLLCVSMVPCELIFKEMEWNSNVTGSHNAAPQAHNHNKVIMIICRKVIWQKGGIAVASPPNSSFVSAWWQHKNDGLAALCNSMKLGFNPTSPVLPVVMDAI